MCNCYRYHYLLVSWDVFPCCLNILQIVWTNGARDWVALTFHRLLRGSNVFALILDTQETPVPLSIPTHKITDCCLKDVNCLRVIGASLSDIEPND